MLEKRGNEHRLRKELEATFLGGAVPLAPGKMPGASADDERVGRAAAVPLPLLDSALESLDATGVGWLVLPGTADTLERGGHLEFLVEFGALSKIETTLCPLGFALVPSAGPGSHRFLLGYDDQARMWLRLDFADHVDLGRHQALTRAGARELLARRVRTDGRYRLCSDDAFWHRLLHRLLSGGEIDSDDLLYLSEQAQATGPLADLVDHVSRGVMSSAELLDVVRRREWQRLASLRPALVRASRKTHLDAHFLPNARHAADRIVHAIRSVIRPSGICVAIIGPDGAGKTTLADALRATLPFQSSYVYMGVWRDYPWERFLRYVPGARLAQRVLRLLARSFQAWLQRARGRVVLLDRFTYDVLLPSPDLDRRGRATVALVQRIGAEPQLVLVLDAPAEVMYARKGEQGIEELERLRQSYLHVARIRNDSAVIDATQPAAAVRDEAQRLVWARLRRHWSQLS